MISALGVYVHQLWMMWLGSGVIGGIGLGLGYISPVSTLIKWFPDRRGMATGMAIMGFGGGAMIGAPLADILMNHFRDGRPRSASGRPSSPWRVDLFRVHAGRRLRLPRAAGRLAARGLDAADAGAKAMITQRPRPLARRAQDAAVLADLGRAVPQRERGHRRDRHGLADAAGDLRRLADRPSRHRLRRSSTTSSGAGRDDRRRLYRAALAVQHRRPLLLGLDLGLHRPQGDLLHVLPARHRALCARALTLAHTGNKALFVLLFGVILSMYGGGFATVPAYLADMFGTQFVGAIHGRLLTAWSAAGIMGPVVVNYIREFEIEGGRAARSVYDVTMYVLAAMLVGGFLCNYLIKPLSDKWFMKDEEVAALQARTQAAEATTGSMGIGAWRLDTTSVLAWIAVGVPIAWGVWITLSNALTLFR